VARSSELRAGRVAMGHPTPSQRARTHYDSVRIKECSRGGAHGTGPLSSSVISEWGGLIATLRTLQRLPMLRARDRLNVLYAGVYTFYYWLLSATDGWLWPTVFAAYGLLSTLGYGALVGWSVLDPCYAMLIWLLSCTIAQCGCNMLSCLCL
jgi:hypothetical protein